MVKCPICGKVKKARGKRYFTCCNQMAFDIKQCLAEEIERKRWRREENSDGVIEIVD